MTKINMKQNVKREFEPLMNSSGYEYVEFSGWKGTGSYFFRKELYARTFGFIEIHLMKWMPNPAGIDELNPRRFQVSLWRCRRETPQHGYGQNEDDMRDYLYCTLSFLLWDIFQVKAYKSPYHEWEFNSPEDLIIQLQDAVDGVIQYGISWLENPESKNPYDLK